MNADLGRHLREFFQTYLRDQRGVSPHTIKSYRDGFKILLAYLASRHPSKRALTVHDLDVKTILTFLQHLEDAGQGRDNSARTRNHRLAAIQSFFRYLVLTHPSFEDQAKRIFSIPVKRTPKKAASSLNKPEIETLLAQPSLKTSDGVRDLSILTFLYNTGARAHEVAGARTSWFDFSQRTVAIIGKGQRSRVTPLWPSTVQLLQHYYERHRRQPIKTATDYFFINQRGGPFTRFGIGALVKKYIKQAVPRCPSLAQKQISTHSLRHTTAVHLLESRVEPNVIKDWLGHASISSTDHYLDTDLNHKRRILEKFGPPDYVVRSLEPKKAEPPDKLLDWLDQL